MVTSNKIKAAQFVPCRNSAAMVSSSTLAAAKKAAELRSSGIQVIDLSVGEPDFDTPEFIKDLAIKALKQGYTKYTPSAGAETFRSNIARYFSENFDSDIRPTEVVAACGGKQALFNAICTLLDSGDECLIPSPYWVTFPEIVKFIGAKPIFIDTAQNDFLLTAEMVAAAATDKTRALIVNSPNNPSGRVISPEEFRRIVEVCAEREIFVIADECYLYFVYPPARVFSAASLEPELRQWVAIAGSFSKTFSMTGWRIGFTIACEAWSKEIAKLQSHSATHPTSFVQIACAEALCHTDEMRAALDSMLQEYLRRRDYFVPALKRINGFELIMPEGAFYAFVDVRQLLQGGFANSAAVADALLAEAHIVVTDGAGFGSDGFLRFSYAASMEKLEKAVSEMKRIFGVK
jgi:aspartate aminotransferase